MRNIDSLIGSMRPRDAEYLADERQAVLNAASYAHERGVDREGLLDLVEMLGAEEQLPQRHRRFRIRLRRERGKVVEVPAETG
jgi:hypothetical protein